MALAVGKSGCVFALEPNSYVYPVLAKNAALNPDKTHILPLPFAATPEDAELVFQYSDSGYCNGGRFAGISRSFPADSDMIVTDVGGVKGPVAGAIDSPRFVGGHPMAGSEQEGPDGADPELFVGATWVLTPTPATDADAYSVVREIVRGLRSSPEANLD